jgi:hypothetical protein
MLVELLDSGANHANDVALRADYRGLVGARVKWLGLELHQPTEII